MPTPSPTSYPFETFLDDLQLCLTVEPPESADLMLTTRDMLDVLAPRYPDMTIRTWIVSRLVLLCVYLAEHADAFTVDETGAGAAHPAEAALSPYVLRALHHAFTDDSPFPAHLPSPDEILHHAREFRRGEERRQVG